MSHYAVAVFSDDCDFDRLLKPYNEHDHDYFEFVVVDYSKIVSDFERFQKNNPSYKFDEYMNLYKYTQKDDQWGYYCNKHGYWDRYSLDGKDYLFEPKRGVKLADGQMYYRKNDIKWLAKDKEAASDAEEFWDDFVGETRIAEPPGIWSRQYFLDRYKTKEQYVKEMSRTIPYAFITPDGVWHSAGRVYSFAMSDETPEEADRYAEEWFAWIASDANPYVSIVDCHV